MGNIPSLKVAVPALVGIIASVVLVIAQGIQDPTTLATVGATVMQSLLGYLVPHQPIVKPNQNSAPPSTPSSPISKGSF